MYRKELNRQMSVQCSFYVSDAANFTQFGVNLYFQYNNGHMLFFGLLYRKLIVVAFIASGLAKHDTFTPPRYLKIKMLWGTLLW